MKKFFLAKSDKNALQNAAESFKNPILKNSALEALSPVNIIGGWEQSWSKEWSRSKSQ